jgi:5,6-dimethylbenzimidazole synthase
VASRDGHSLTLACGTSLRHWAWLGSIINPDALLESLSIPREWCLIGYVCLGYPLQAEERPELEIIGWQSRLPLLDVLFER